MSELEQRANEAWLAMQRDVRPMPPGVAIDYAQEACGDRDEAVSALLDAAAKRLCELLPEGHAVEFFSAGTAVSVLGNIRSESYLHAEVCAAEVEGYNRQMLQYCEGDPARQHEADLAAAWLRWCAYVESDLRRCRAISAAAYPDPQPEAV